MVSNSTFSYTEHIKKLVVIALPVTLAQLGHIMVGLSDTFMAGRLGGNEIAAVTLAFSLYFPFLFFCVGLSSGPSPIIAKALGEGNESSIQQVFWNSLYMNLFFGLCVTALLLATSQFLYLFNPNALLVQMALPFHRIMALSILPIMVFQTFRQYAEGMANTAPAMYIGIAGNVLNVFLNYTLATGDLGFPEMGLEGIAWATVISRVLMAVVMAVYVYTNRYLSTYFRSNTYLFINHDVLGMLLKKSLPIGIQFSMESGVFSLGAIMIGWLGTTATASHQIALNLAATTYMAATGLSAAVAVRVGYVWGAGYKHDIKKAGIAAFILVSIFMLLMSALFIIFRFELPALFVQDKAIIEMTAMLLLTAALFQIADGIQVIGIGALRGIGDVVSPTIISIMAYWVIGIPFGYYLTFHEQYGVQGIWYGFTLGLFVAAILLVGRFLYLSEKMSR
jgi:MATE family multidrug resistance protein